MVTALYQMRGRDDALVLDSHEPKAWRTRKKHNVIKAIAELRLDERKAVVRISRVNIQCPLLRGLNRAASVSTQP